MLASNNSSTKTIIIPPEYIGWRFDAALAQLLPEYSRSKISILLKQGKASIKGKIIANKDRIKNPTAVDLLISLDAAYKWHAQDIKLDIVYCDDDIIVINKPAGLVVHPGAGNSHNTLANALLFFDNNLSQLDRAGIVHRLDKDTSGLLVVARSLIAQKSLIEQLQTHQVTREYVAIVYGYMIAGGTINEPIGRHPKDRIKQAININGKQAITNYRVLERFKNHSVIKVNLETGRTHQIRVHMAHIGYSLVNDSVYGKYSRSFCFPKGASEDLKQALKNNINRQALHAKKLSITHPVSGEIMSWEIDIATDMQLLIDNLRMHDSNDQ